MFTKSKIANICNQLTKQMVKCTQQTKLKLLNEMEFCFLSFDVSHIIYL